MTIGSFCKHLKSKDVTICLRHNKNVLWTGEAGKFPGRYRHYKIDNFLWDDYYWYYDIQFLRDNDIVIKEVK